MKSTESGQPPGLGGRLMDRLATRLLGLEPSTTAYTIDQVRVPMRDGVELAADLYRPTSSPVGTILVRGPYGRSALMALPMARIFASRDYNALFVSCRGTFGSGGEFVPMVSEVDDGLDVVAWMRDQPWYTGSFATVGGSYLAFTQWALLTDPPPDLAAAVVSISPHDFGEHVWGTGAFRLDFLGWSDWIVHQEEGGVVRGLGSHRHRRAAQRQGDGRAAAGAGRPDPPGGTGRLVSGLGHPPRPDRPLLGSDEPEHRAWSGRRSRSCSSAAGRTSS